MLLGFIGTGLCCAQLLQSCLTLQPQEIYSLLVSSVQRIRQARIRKWLPCSPSGNLPNTRMEHIFRCVSCIAGRIFTAEPLGNPIGIYTLSSKYPVGETEVFSLDTNWNYNDPDHIGGKDHLLTYVKAGLKTAQQNNQLCLSLSSNSDAQ